MSALYKNKALEGIIMVLRVLLLHTVGVVPLARSESGGLSPLERGVSNDHERHRRRRARWDPLDYAVEQFTSPQRVILSIVDAHVRSLGVTY